MTTKGAPSPAAPSTASGIPTTPGWYIVGLREYRGMKPPRHDVTFGGISFPLYCYDENPTIKNDTREYNQRRTGQRIYLDLDDLERIRTACGKKVVRQRGLDGNAVILRIGQKGYRPLKTDTALECFLYVTAAASPEEAGANAVADLPPPIAQE